MSTTSPRRTCVQAVRLTPGELAVLRGRAGASGVSLATYLRERALARRIRSHGSRLDRSDVDTLRRLGVALNRFTRAANTARCVVGAEELAVLLAEMRSTAQGLRAKLSS